MSKVDWPLYMKLAPEAAIDHLRKKGYKTTFDYTEMQREEHTFNFTVAKAANIDLLQDIRSEVDKALADGTTLETFKKNLKPVLVKKGWWGKKDVTDPNTGEVKTVQLGSPRRLQIIFDTNLRTAYAAGHWEGIQKAKALRPYLRYVAVMDERTREEHRHWHDVVKPVDDPFWNEHYPPNGWRCRCSVQQLSARDLERRGLKVTEHNPDRGPKTYLDKRTGEAVVIPEGIDPSFAYNVGKSRMKAMVPPPVDLPLSTPFIGAPVDLPLPAPRPLDESRILEQGLSSEEYVRIFLKEFGGDIGQPVVFKDAAGDHVVISEELFKNVRGGWKVKKRGREKFLLLLADSIKQPDEILVSWLGGGLIKPQLFRSYIVTHSSDAGSVAGFTMFKVSKSGWSGVTSFAPDEIKYLDKQRNGAVIYRRPELTNK